MPKSLSAKWTLDPTREPKAVDLIFLSEGSSGNGLLRRGIYRIEGDRHILCLADRSDEERPTAFDSNLGTLVVWKRK